MDLFDHIEGTPHNLLPYDGAVYYYGSVFSVSVADAYFKRLMADIDWQHDKAHIGGKIITTKRKIAWHGDRDFSYTYSNMPKVALPWTDDLLDLKEMAECETAETYNACLLNLYHTGAEGMAWHSDAEKDLKKNGAIASISFGAARKFSFKHKKTGAIVSKILEHGSLLVMKGETQSHWLHSLRPSQIVKTPRINLTFRTIDK